MGEDGEWPICGIRGYFWEYGKNEEGRGWGGDPFWSLSLDLTCSVPLYWISLPTLFFRSCLLSIPLLSLPQVTMLHLTAVNWFSPSFLRWTPFILIQGVVNETKYSDGSASLKFSHDSILLSHALYLISSSLPLRFPVSHVSRMKRASQNLINITLYDANDKRYLPPLPLGIWSL